MDPNERSLHGKFGPLKNSLLQTQTSRSPSVTSRLLAAGVVEASNTHFVVTEAVLQWNSCGGYGSNEYGRNSCIRFVALLSLLPLCNGDSFIWVVSRGNTEPDSTKVPRLRFAAPFGINDQKEPTLIFLSCKMSLLNDQTSMSQRASENRYEEVLTTDLPS